MNSHKLLKHDNDEMKDKKMQPVERLDLDLLAQVTHNSIPVMGLTKSFASKVRNLSKSKKMQNDDNLLDVTMHSGRSASL